MIKINGEKKELANINLLDYINYSIMKTLEKESKG